MVFQLEPFSPAGFSGWIIRIAPAPRGPDSSVGPLDCIGTVRERAQSKIALSVVAPKDAVEAQAQSWNLREFDFVSHAPDCRAAWNSRIAAFYPQFYPVKLSDQEREQAKSKISQFPQGRASFRILDWRSGGPPDSLNPTGIIEWLKFEITLENLPQATASASLATIPPANLNQKIRDADVEGFLSTHYAKVDGNLEDLKSQCPEGEDPIRSVEVQYGDLDGDGQEEALFQGFTCMSGSAGVDYAGIVKLQPNGKFVSLPIAKIPDTFKGRNPFEGLSGHVRWDIENGRFVEIYPVYKGDECEACSEGGERKFVFCWDGNQFALDNIVDTPPEKSRD